MKYLFLSLCLLLLVVNTRAQPLTSAKKIKARGDYTHPASDAFLPEVLGSFERDIILRYDVQGNTIEAKYTSAIPEGKTEVSVCIFPAGDGSTDRLRTAFLKELALIGSFKHFTVNADFICCDYKKDGYKVNGLRAAYDEPGGTGSLELYECGGWFLEVKAVTNVPDMKWIGGFNKAFIDAVDPVRLIKNAPLEGRMSVHVAPGSARDTLMLHCVLAACFTELDWVKDHVDSLEMASCYPSFYLDMHAEALKSMLRCADTSHIQTVTPQTTGYFRELRELEKNGFLDEYVADTYKPYWPDQHDNELNFAAYDKWKKDHLRYLTQPGLFYIIINPKKKK